MTKTQALRVDIQKELKTLTTNVYYGIAPYTISYPYLVYEFTEISHTYGKTLMQMEVNVIGYGTDTASIDALADEIQNRFNKYYGINSYIEYSIYRGLRNMVQEEDKKVIRRRLTFEIHLNERKED